MLGSKRAAGGRTTLPGRFTAPVLAVGLIALAGCGSSSTSSSSSTPSTPAATSPAVSATTPAAGGSVGQALHVAAGPGSELRFQQTSLTAKAGQVSIAFTNMTPLMHNLTIADESGAVQGFTPTFNGATKTLTVSLKPGTYKFYCSVPGHRQAGMEGTLTVQ